MVEVGCAGRQGDLVQGIVQDQVLPKIVGDDGVPTVAVLPVGDDIARAGAAGTLKNLEMRVGLGKFVEADEVEIRVNNKLATTVSQLGEGGTTTFAAQFRIGGNDLAFRAVKRGPSADKPLSVHTVELHVAYVT